MSGVLRLDVGGGAKRIERSRNVGMSGLKVLGLITVAKTMLVLVQTKDTKQS
jgi:hypothetical protein